MSSKFKCETHKLRKRREGTRLPYVCLECGKEFKILNGVLVARNSAEEEDYYKRRRELLLKGPLPTAASSCAIVTSS